LTESKATVAAGAAIGAAAGAANGAGTGAAKALKAMARERMATRVLLNIMMDCGVVMNRGLFN